jgi:hypothetical protein
LVCRTNQNGQHPWQTRVILEGLNGKNPAADLAAERERSRSAEHREGNLRDHIVHLGKRVATLREALVRARDFIIRRGQGDFYTINGVVAAIDAVLRETKGGDGG